MNYNKKNLTFVIPILNEAKNIKNLIPNIYSELKKIRFRHFEIIIVDDNSHDNIKEVFKKLKKKYKNIKLIIRKLKPDLSKSCIQGFENARFNNVMVMDGDAQHSPKYIKHLIYQYFNLNLDFVIGSRNFSKKIHGLSILRKIASIKLIFIINILLGKKTADPMSGFFIFRKKIYKKNKRKLFKKGYKILADLIYSSVNNLKIKDVYIDFKSRKKGKSKMNYKILFLIIIFILRSFRSRFF